MEIGLGPLGTSCSLASNCFDGKVFPFFVFFGGKFVRDDDEDRVCLDCSNALIWYDGWARRRKMNRIERNKRKYDDDDDDDDDGLRSAMQIEEKNLHPPRTQKGSISMNQLSWLS